MFPLTQDASPGVRFRWEYDTHYQTEGSFAYDSKEETEQAERDEIYQLEVGALVALVCIVQRKCPACGDWKNGDVLCGIVIEPDEAKLLDFAKDNMEWE